jgi:UDP:flavonoid glycosyltransferase YjiC (YdhE family)
MTNFLVASSPIYGHVTPLVRIAAHLVSAGHEVRFLTGARFRAVVERAGARHVPLPAEADYDDRDLNRSFPGRSQRSGIRRVLFDIEHVFIAPIPVQTARLHALLADRPADVILLDQAFLGAVPLLLDESRARPLIVNVGITPLNLSSRDTAPWGLGLPPSSTAPGRIRNRLLTLAVQRLLFGGLHRRFDRTLRGMGLPVSPVFFLDWPLLADRFLQLGVPGLEHPRSDLPGIVRFVGAVPPPEADGDWRAPSWWADLAAARAAGRPVVHVTQGTAATDDLGQLIAPTLRALAGDDVLVVAATGGPDPATVPGEAPDNARVARFIPYTELLPYVDVVVTNGGFGGAQLALSRGIPLVVAGGTEDKPEVASRVAASGAGINLRTATPKTAAILAAVRAVLTEPRYRERARALAAEYARYDALALIADEVAELTGTVGRRV